MNFMYNHLFSDYNQITERIYLGNIAGAMNGKFKKDNNIGYIINLSNQWYPKQNDIKYLDVNISDSPDTNIKEHFKKIIDFFNQGLASDKNIYIHCRAGISRSASGLIAFLMSKGLNMRDSVNYISSRRKIIQPNPGFWIQLMIYERELYGKNTVDYSEKYF
jgi:atypical dual specificity phosphatase